MVNDDLGQKRQKTNKIAYFIIKQSFKNFKFQIFLSRRKLNVSILVWSISVGPPKEPLLKFVFSKKAIKIDDIFTVDLTLSSKCQIDGEDFINFYGLLRKHKL